MHKRLQQLALLLLKWSWTRQSFRSTFYQWLGLENLIAIIQGSQELMQMEWHIS